MPKDTLSLWPSNTILEPGSINWWIIGVISLLLLCVVVSYNLWVFCLRKNYSNSSTVRPHNGKTNSLRMSYAYDRVALMLPDDSEIGDEAEEAEEEDTEQNELVKQDED